MKSVLPYLKSNLKYFVIGPVFKLIEAVLELFMPIYMAKIIDIGIVNNDTAFILKNGLIMLAIAVLGLISAIICQYSAAVAGQNFGTSLRTATFKKIMNLSYSQIDEISSSTLFTRATADVSQLQTAVNMTIRLVVRAPFICIGSVVAAMIIDLRLGFVLLVALPSFGALLFIIMKLTAPRYVKTQKSLDTVAEDVMQTLEGTKVIRAFTAEQREQTEFEGDNGDLMDSSIGVGKIAALLNPLTTLVLNFLIIAIVYIGGIRINAGGLSGGELLAFISYVTQMLTTLIVVANMVSMFTRSKASLDRIHEIFEIPVAAEESINPNTFFKNDEIVVEFKNVSFSYNLNSFDLENISFKIKCGESLGIIGATGSGKTTLVNLISKFYLSQSGKIEVLGIDVVKWNKNDLRKQVAVVTQNVQLISGTILENLIMGNENASKEEIEHACIVAQAAEFIENLSGGYNFKVARNGRNLSGGQRQRIAIARALLKNSKLLIFDDSSSALDFSTDAAFREQLQKHFRNTAKIFISQRINNVKNCDSIICLSEGKIAGIGSHTYLLESCTEYSEIASSQSEGGVI